MPAHGWKKREQIQTTTYLGLVAVIGGMVMLGWAFYSDRSKTRETGTADPRTLAEKTHSSRENESLEFAGYGVLLIFGILYFVKLWKFESDTIWVIGGFYGGAGIVILLFSISWDIISSINPGNPVAFSPPSTFLPHPDPF